MRNYLEFLNKIMEEGIDREDRTGVGTRSIFGYQMRFDLQKGFPMVTTKKIFLRSIIHELIWFLQGETNIKYLKDNKVSIWDAWADENGDLGRVYGAQWRSWATPNGESIDQISNVVEQIKANPNSRRHLVVSFNPGEVKDMALPPCHAFFQFYVANNKLSCQLYQRSADAFLGVPFNISSYAILTQMIAQVCDLEVGEFVHTFGDAHIYHNHFDQVKEQLTRTPKKLPTLELNSEIKNLFDFSFDDVVVKDYEFHPRIKGEIAV